jgi:hypothetical protein
MLRNIFLVSKAVKNGEHKVCSICVYSYGKQRQTAAYNGTQKQEQLVDIYGLSGENREKP